MLYLMLDFLEAGCAAGILMHGGATEDMLSGKSLRKAKYPREKLSNHTQRSNSYMKGESTKESVL